MVQTPPNDNWSHFGTLKIVPVFSYTNEVKDTNCLQRAELTVELTQFYIFKTHKPRFRVSALHLHR